MSKILRTERLTLRPVKAGDEFDFSEICSNATAMRYLPSLVHHSADETAAWIDLKISKAGACLWAIFLVEGDSPIGFVNYLGETRIPGMGYVIHPDYWGQGYAPEACRAVLDYGFEQLGFDRVELWIDETNAASHRVAQKLGFKIKGRIPLNYAHQNDYHYMVVYGLRAEEWLASHAKQASVSNPGTTLFRAEPVLFVRDVLVAAHYYRDCLGFHIDFIYGEPPRHAAVWRGDWTGSGVTIQLSKTDNDLDLSRSAYLYVFTDTKLDALFADFRKREVEIVSPPTDQPWGLREFSVRDLDGHLLIFATSH